MQPLVTNQWWLGAKEPSCKRRRCKRRGFNPWVRKIPWRRKWRPSPVFLPGESHDRGAWQTIVHRVAQSRARLSTDHQGGFLPFPLKSGHQLAIRVPKEEEHTGFPQGLNMAG